MVGGDFYRQKFGMVLLVAPRTTILWYNAFPGTALVSYVSVLNAWTGPCVLWLASAASRELGAKIFFCQRMVLNMLLPLACPPI